MKKLLIVFLFLACVVQVRSQNPNTAKFPGAVATDQDLFVAKNVARPSVTLTAGVDNATLTLPVTDGTKFRQYQIIGVDLELMQVCSTAALSLTACSRGLGGTTAASHLNGAVIGFPFADIQVNQAAAEIKAIETALGANLGNVVTPTSLGTWAGSANITTVGTLSSGTVPWARLSGVPSYEDPLTFSAPLSRSVNAISCSTCLVSTGSYSDPAWLTISKGKVGLGSVENTALSTWAGSANITTLGTISSGTVPWARLSGVPTSYYQTVKASGVAQTQRAGLSFSTAFSLADDGANGDTDVSMASQTDPGWLTLTKGKVGLGNVENTALSTGNAGTATALAADPANCAAGSAAGGITANGTAEACIVVNVRQVGFVIDDPNVALAVRTYYSVWRNELSSNATIASGYCETDTDTTPAVIQFQKDDGSPVNMLSSNLTCSVAGASTTSFVAGENVVASGNRLDFVIVNNTSSKRVSLSIKYTY